MTLRDELAQLEPRARNIARHAETALRALRDEIDLHDGYPTSTIGASDPPATPPPILEGECRERITVAVDNGITTRYCGQPRPCPDHDTPIASTSVERAAGHLSPLLTEWNHLTRTIAELLGALTAAEKAINRRIPIEKRAVCNRGLGRDGVIEWGDPLCGNYAETDRAGLCAACAKREYRWRKEHGLPARDRGAA